MKPPLLALLLITHSLSGAVFEQMDTTKLMQCAFSSKYHNRIAIDGGRIKKAIFIENGISVRLDNETGQIFVQPMVDRPPETTLSIISDENLVQDIHLTFVEKPSEVLILQPEECAIIQQVFPTAKSQQAIIDSILNGEIPEGYTWFEGSGQSIHLQKGIYAQQLSVFSICEETLYVWQIENRSKRQQSIKHITFQGGEQIYLGKNQLGSKERTCAIILGKHGL